MRSDWTALPATVTYKIAERVGGAFDVIPATTGDHAEIASTVVGPDATIFVKAASGPISVPSLRYELAATTIIDRWPPAVLWHFEVDGWLVVATEHLHGPHPDLSPGSPDLDVLAAALDRLQATPAPAGTWYDPASRLGFELPAAAGPGLVHTDLNPTNLIMTAGDLRIVDWAYTTKAAPWVELALLVQWLIGSGHTPEQAEAWLGRFPAWAAADRLVLDRFASECAAKWLTKSQRSTAQWVHGLATWTGEWADYRRMIGHRGLSVTGRH
ncbi:phosphotransferase [Micromonospora lupini]|uniref:phosphotransferase family protein n=1 Tax=Micromonospora lupini TaxID=285679 RepID=UPI0022522AA9|nr:phosphotransferase [Micromonospora lupini]MCX5066730.1 phosphotransferase [Micromonospora lupini]